MHPGLTKKGVKQILAKQTREIAQWQISKISILPLLKPVLPSINSSVFFNTGKRAALRGKIIKLSLVTETQSGKTEFHQVPDVLSFKWTTIVNKALKN